MRPVAGFPPYDGFKISYQAAGRTPHLANLAGQNVECEELFQKVLKGYLNFLPIFAPAHGFIVVESLSPREPTEDLWRFVFAVGWN